MYEFIFCIACTHVPVIVNIKSVIFKNKCKREILIIYLYI